MNLFEMNLKTLDYQVFKAVQILEQNRQTYIGVFGKWEEIKTLLREAHYPGIIKWQSRIMTATHGTSQIRFFDLSQLDRLEDLCGYQFTHIFIRDTWKYEKTNFLKSRLRSTVKFIEPMGYYDEFGVTRIEDY